MTFQQRPTYILKILKEELPQCFKKGGNKIPLAKDIHTDVIEYYPNDCRFDNAALRYAIQFYVSSTAYLKKIVTGSLRIGLKGNSLGVVTQKEESAAKRQLTKRKLEKKRMAFCNIANIQS